MTFDEPLNAIDRDRHLVRIARRINAPIAGLRVLRRGDAPGDPDAECRSGPPLDLHGSVRGGAGGVADVAGNPLAADYSWVFSTGAPPPPPPDEGPGGPILVVGSTGNPFSRYYAEILRAEGLNAFEVKDLTAVNATALAGFDVVILGDIPLTTAEVDDVQRLGDRRWSPGRDAA